MLCTAKATVMMRKPAIATLNMLDKLHDACPNDVCWSLGQLIHREGNLLKVCRPEQYDDSADTGEGYAYTYDAMNRLIQVTGSDGAVKKRYIYDKAGRRTHNATTGQASQSYTYDALGHVTSATDGAGNATRYGLDHWGRIVDLEKADGSHEYYGYDYAGNRILATDGKGHTTTWSYNRINRPAVMTDAEGRQETYAYDIEGRLCKKTDRNGGETHYTYNLYGNLLSRRAGELVETYQYTPEGLLKAAIAGGMRYTYTYDAMGRLAGKEASGRKLMSLSYDLNGNLTQQEDVTGKVTEYRYDRRDQLREVWDSGKQVASYTYYSDGSVKSLKQGQSLYTEYGYDRDRNLTHQRTVLGEELLVDNHYRYDGNGNRLEKEQLQGITRYAYDVLNRLKRVEYPTFTEELFYDKAGNRVRRVAAGEEEIYSYDSRNRLRERITKGGIETNTYDEAGNLLRDVRAIYTYDAFNRTAKVESFSGEIQNNRYDAEGLRPEIEENGRLVQFIYRDREVVLEEQAEEKVRYIRSDQLLASDAQHAKTWYHYASDELGSITHVEQAGEILNRYEYDAWGNLITCEERVENRFQFTGQQFDPVSQQYYLRARYYNPVIGRFTQEDTYYEDGLNLYAYCRNNPVYYVDPSGNICKKAAERICKLIDEGKIKGQNRTKLEQYLKENAGKLTKAEKDIAKKLGVKIVSNPNGRKGGEAHQRVIEDIKTDAGKRGLTYGTEYKYDTTGGYKNSRYADVVVYDRKGRIMEIHQVGRTTKRTGAPVSRERKAIRDIRSSKEYNGAKIIYHPYDR